jgi:hypothetical protein
MSDPNPYVILRSVGSAPLPAAWQEHGPRQQAVSAEQAIRKAVAATETPDGATLVAVPARSWKPMTVTVETTTRVKIG